MDETRRKIIEKGVQAVLAEHKVPYHVHRAVLEQLAAVVKDHRADLFVAKAERALHNEMMAAHQEQIKKSNQLMERHENQLDKFDATLKRMKSIIPEKGDPGKSIKGDRGDDGIAPTLDEILAAVLSSSKFQDLLTLPEVPKPVVDTEKLFTQFVERLKKDKHLTISDLKDGQGFVYNKKRYKFSELMHGSGGSSNNASANVVTQYSLEATQDGDNVIVELSQLDHFADFSNVIAAMRNQIPQTNGVTCTITGTQVIFLNADAGEVFSITYAYT